MKVVLLSLIALSTFSSFAMTEMDCEMTAEKAEQNVSFRHEASNTRYLYKSWTKFDNTTARTKVVNSELDKVDKCQFEIQYYETTAVANEVSAIHKVSVKLKRALYINKIDKACHSVGFKRVTFNKSDLGNNEMSAIVICAEK